MPLAQVSENINGKKKAESLTRSEIKYKGNMEEHEKELNFMNVTSVKEIATKMHICIIFNSTLY